VANSMEIFGEIPYAGKVNEAPTGFEEKEKGKQK